MRRLSAILSLLMASGILIPGAQANDKVIFGLDWKAEAEYGGFTRPWLTGSTPSTGWM